MIEVTVYECKHCHVRYDVERDCKVHEKQCYHNKTKVKVWDNKLSEDKPYPQYMCEDACVSDCDNDCVYGEPFEFADEPCETIECPYEHDATIKKVRRCL